MRRLVSLTLALLLAACAPPPALEGPMPFGMENVTPAGAPDSVAPPATGRVAYLSASASNEPAGFSPIVDLPFGPQKLLTSYLSGPDATHGITLGKVRTESAAQIAAGPNLGYAHRCVFGIGSLAGRGVGCSLLAKENLPGNTDGNTVHSYRQYYERGAFQFGNLDPSGGITNVFESVHTDGLKLLGYLGVGCKGNYNATQIILWAQPVPGNSGGVGKAIGQFTLQLRTQLCGAREKTAYSTVRFSPGVWHTYEFLADAGDVDKSNGTLTFWLDGVKIMTATNRSWRTSSAPRGFLGRHWNPVQGGGCGTQPSCKRTTQGVLDIDGLYVSVAQPVD